MPLIIHIKQGDSVIIGEIKIVITEISGKRCYMEIDAPRDMRIERHHVSKTDLGTSACKVAKLGTTEDGGAGTQPSPPVA